MRRSVAWAALLATLALHEARAADYPRQKRTFVGSNPNGGGDFTVFESEEARNAYALAKAAAELGQTDGTWSGEARLDPENEQLDDVKYSEQVVNETFKYLADTVEESRVAWQDANRATSDRYHGTCGMLWDRYSKWADTLERKPSSDEVNAHLVGWELHDMGRGAKPLKPKGSPYTFDVAEARVDGCRRPTGEEYGPEQHAEIELGREMVLGKDMDGRRRLNYREVVRGGALGAPSVFVTLDGITLVTWHSIRTYEHMTGPDHDGSDDKAAYEQNQQRRQRRRRELLTRLERASAPGASDSAFERVRFNRNNPNDEPDYGIWLSRRNPVSAEVGDMKCTGVRARGFLCEEALWGMPQLIARVSDSDLFKEPHWNPVLYQPPPKDGGGDAPIWCFFHVGRSRDRFATFYTRSFDGGKTFEDKPTRIGGHSVLGIGPNRHAPIAVQGDGLTYWVFGGSADPTPAGVADPRGTIKGWSAFGFTHDEGMTWTVRGGRISGDAPGVSVVPQDDGADGVTMRARERAVPRAPARGNSHSAPAPVSAPARRRLLRKRGKKALKYAARLNGGGAFPQGSTATEPALFDAGDGLVGAALRADRGFIYMAVGYNASLAYAATRDSSGGGMTAGGHHVFRTELRSNTAGVAAASLLGGRVLVVAHNPVQSTEPGMSRNDYLRAAAVTNGHPPSAAREDLRYPMRLSISMNGGQHWACYLDVDTRPGEYTSPSLVAWSHDRVRAGPAARVDPSRRGTGLSLAYQWRRRDIAYVEFTAEQLLDHAECEVACTRAEALRHGLCGGFYTPAAPAPAASFASPGSGVALDASVARGAASASGPAPRRSRFPFFG